MVGVDIPILSLRLKSNPSLPTSIDARNSMIFTVRSDSPLKVDDLKWLGWERNDRQKFGARMVDISSTTDPTKYVSDIKH